MKDFFVRTEHPPENETGDRSAHDGLYATASKEPAKHPIPLIIYYIYLQIRVQTA